MTPGKPASCLSILSKRRKSACSSPALQSRVENSRAERHSQSKLVRNDGFDVICHAIEPLNTPLETSYFLSIRISKHFNRVYLKPPYAAAIPVRMTKQRLEEIPGLGSTFGPPTYGLQHEAEFKLQVSPRSTRPPNAASRNSTQHHHAGWLSRLCHAIPGMSFRPKMENSQSGAHYSSPLLTGCAAVAGHVRFLGPASPAVPFSPKLRTTVHASSTHG